MTTATVARIGAQICIAADSLTSFGDQHLTAEFDTASEKIQDLCGSHIVIVGSAAHSLVLDAALRDPALDIDLSSRTTIFRTFLKLHAQLKEHYFLNVKDDEEDPYESTRIDALIANTSGIYAVYALREVYEFKKFWALGSGSEYALGAMFAASQNSDSAEHVAIAGVQAGAAFDASSSLPYTHRCISVLAA